MIQVHVSDGLLVCCQCTFKIHPGHLQAMSKLLNANLCLDNSASYP